MSVDVALDARLTRRMSFGMRAYAVELARYLPVVAPDLHVAPLHGGANSGIDEQLLMPLRVARMRPRLTHYTTIFAPLLAPRPYIQMIHDLIHVVHPEFYGRGVALYYATVARRLTQRARFLVMGDERTVEQCERYLGVDPATCRVTPLGYDPARAAETSIEQSARPYVLYSGNLRPHKNVETLLAAWSALPPSIEIDLYLTGDAEDDGRFAAFESPCRRVVMLGTVSEERLWQLYRGALAYVHPALIEGFGLPMLEAMAAGTPVIASRECVSTVVREHAALFEARDVDALRSLLADVVQGSPRGESARQGERNTCGRIRGSVSLCRPPQSIEKCWREPRDPRKLAGRRGAGHHAVRPGRWERGEAPGRAELPTRKLSVVVNGTALPPNPPPVIVGGRVFVPIVPVFAALAIGVSREGTTLVANAPSAVLRINIGSAQAKVNNRVVTMDGPAAEINGTTYVPLRFIADSLGAVATYDKQSDRIQIVSSLLGRATVMSQTGPAGETTVTGVVSALDQNSTPATLTVVRGGNARAISVGSNAKITIQDVRTHTTVDGTLAAIHVGDSVSVRIARDGSILQILDLYASRTSKVIAVSGTSIVLSDGYVITPSRATTITLNGDAVQLSDLASGDEAIVRSNPETGEATEIIASRRTAATPAAGASAAPGVTISSFSVAAPRPLRSGESFDVALNGTPGGTATYDIGSFLTGLPMREAQPGEYTARYVVGGSINFASVPVFGRLTVGSQSTAKVPAQTLLSVATLPPQINDIAPSQNQSVNNPKPSIYATFTAPSGVGINPSSATISVNGQDVTGASTRTESFITYSPVSNVRDGAVSVTVRVADLAGNVASRSWSFMIRSR